MFFATFAPDRLRGVFLKNNEAILIQEWSMKDGHACMALTMPTFRRRFSCGVFTVAPFLLFLLKKPPYKLHVLIHGTSIQYDKHNWM